MDKKTIKDVDVKGKRVLVRVDFNVPIKEGKVGDDTRIVTALPTISYLLDNGAAVVLMSHLGRPKGQVKPELSLAPVAAHLGEKLGKEVKFLSDCVGDEVKAAVHALKPGDVVVLENLRFHAEERKNAPDFAKQLAELGEVYVNDAFGTAHRAHASTVGVAEYLPAVAGLLMEKEINFLGKAIENPERPFVALLGGAKVSDKISVIENLLGKVDELLIGGGMANTFFKAQGLEMGDSLVEEDSLDLAKDLLAKGGDKLVLPTDVVVADAFAADANAETVGVDEVATGWRILDIGPATVAAYGEIIVTAKTVVWNGPMGVYEFARFAVGTKSLAEKVAHCAGVTIIGGGDAVAAVEESGYADEMTHISTGGGASLKFLEGKTLPGIAALMDK